MAVSPISHHEARVMDRGGKKTLYKIKSMVEVTWNRVRDDMSTAKITLPATAARDQKWLSNIDPGRHELCVFRDGERQWEGPFNTPSFGSSSVTLTANDTLHYYNRTVMHAAYSSAYPHTEYAVNRLKRIINAELSRKEALGYNLLQYLRTYVDADDAKTSAVTAPWALYVYQHLDDMAQHAGIDYTTVGRMLHIWDTSKPKMGQTPVVGKNDFDSDPELSVYGAELSTRSVTTDGQGGFGVYGGTDPYYGEVELLNQMYDPTTDTAKPTKAQLNAQAQRNQGGRNPTPALIRLPENSRLSNSSSLKFEHLIPGIYVPLRGTFGYRTINQMQKLQNVTVTENAKGESIQVSLYPASGDTGDTDEG